MGGINYLSRTVDQLTNLRLTAITYENETFNFILGDNQDDINPY
jgi:hypothetical protein